MKELTQEQQESVNKWYEEAQKLGLPSFVIYDNEIGSPVPPKPKPKP
jgi:hypothetical protein